MSSGHVGPLPSGIAPGKRIARPESGSGAGNVALLQLLRGIGDAFECKSVAVFSFDGKGFRKVISVPEETQQEVNASILQEGCLYRCISSKEDQTPPPDVEIGSDDDLFALPLFSENVAAGVLAILGPKRDREAVIGFSRLLKCTLSAFLLPAADENRGGAGAFEKLLAAIGSFAQSASVVDRLTSLTVAVRDAFGLDAIQLYCEVEGRPELIISEGESIRVDAYVGILESLKRGMITTGLRHEPSSNMTKARTVIPVDSSKGSPVVIVYEVDAERSDAYEVREGIRQLYHTLLGLTDLETGVSFAWLTAIEEMEKIASEASGTGVATSTAVLGRILERLKETGFIRGYGLLPEGDVACVSSSEKDGNGMNRKEDIFAGLMRDSIEAGQLLYDSTNRSLLAFPVRDNGDGAWSVAFELPRMPKLMQEKEMWQRLSRSFGILIGGFVLKAKNRMQSEEIQRLKAGASAFLVVSSDIESADTLNRLVSKLTEGISRMTKGRAYGLVNEGEDFRLVDPAHDTFRVSADEISTMLASSPEVSRHVHDVPPDILGEKLSELAGSETDKRIYAVTVSSRYGDLKGIVLIAGQSNYFLEKTREDTLSGLASLANIRMDGINLAEESALERKRLKKVEEVISRISLAEGDNNIVSSIVEAASLLTNSDLSALAIIDVEKGKFISGMTKGFEISEEVIKRWYNDGVTGRILRTLEAEIVNDYASDPDREQYALKALKFRQIAGVPIRIDVKQRGFLAVMNTRDGRYGMEHIRTLELLSNIASSTIRAATAKEERRRLVSDFDKLQTAELRLYSSKTFSELIELVAEEVKNLFHASPVLITAEVNNVKRILFSTLQEIEEGDVVYNSGPIGLQFDEQLHSSRIVERATLEEEWSKSLGTNELLLVRSGMQHDSLVIAAVNSEGAPKYGAEDIENFSKISRMVSTALDKTRLLAGINEKLKHIEITHSIVNALVYGKKEYEIFDSVLPTLVDMCGADLGLLWKYEPEAQKMKVSAEYYKNMSTEHLVGYEVQSNQGIVGSVVRNKLPVLIANAAIDNKAVHIRGTNVEKFESVLGMPLIVNEKLLGVLMVYRDNPPPFTSAELDTLSSVSNDISLVMAKHSIDSERKDYSDWPHTD